MEKFIVWEKKYLIGINEIDEQHEKLIDLINEFYWTFKQGRSREDINIFFKKTKDFIKIHLELEEYYFEKFNFEFKDEHKIQHDFFRNETKKLEEKFYSGEYTVSYEFMSLLRKWFLDHIQTSDRKYIECFKANGLM